MISHVFTWLDFFSGLCGHVQSVLDWHNPRSSCRFLCDLFRQDKFHLNHPYGSPSHARKINNGECGRPFTSIPKFQCEQIKYSLQVRLWWSLIGEVTPTTDDKLERPTYCIDRQWSLACICIYVTVPCWCMVTSCNSRVAPPTSDLSRKHLCRAFRPSDDRMRQLADKLCCLSLEVPGLISLPWQIMF